MNFMQIKETDSRYYMNTFGERTPVCFTEGRGIVLTDTEGKQYRDFFAGIAVNCLGHSHPRLTEELQDQIGKLIHVSNVYYNENQTRLAQILAENTCADRVFFANSGAEANEGAIKLAKKYYTNQGRWDKHEFITLEKSFHGRTLATVAATAQEKYQKPYRPLLEKFIHVPINDEAALRGAVNPNTAAIMIELIQGESGVVPLDRDYVDAVVKICKENDCLLIVDEVQTGIGRTGKLFAHEHYGIEPDIFTMAKALGGGVPMGAFAAKQRVADAFRPGDHGTTFGGGPLACRAGLVVMDELLHRGVLENAAGMGAYFRERLTEVSAQTDKIETVRGMGLMLGVVLKDEIAKEVGTRLRENGYLVGVVGTKVLRLVPPLIVTKEDIDGFCAALKQVLSTI